VGSEFNNSIIISKDQTLRLPVSCYRKFAPIGLLAMMDTCSGNFNLYSNFFLCKYQSNL